jgi:type I restriction enzyme S subunit
VCDKLEQAVEESLKKAESLRQSILKKAFEGKLVRQDPNDEPAEKLLQRIKEEKEKMKDIQNKTARKKK